MTRSVPPRRPHAHALGTVPLRSSFLAGVSLFALIVGLADAEAASLKSSLANAQATQATANATAIAQSQAAAAASVASASHANLTKATNSLRSALMAQAQAAAARVRNSSTSFTGNGLGIGALDPVTGETTWIGANAPVAAASNPNEVTIDQTKSRAVLTWRSFNVGADTKLTYAQDDTNWIALNRVTGGGTAPSQILGTIAAKGSVLVINQNGIVFGAGSQINVHSLIATTMEIGRSTDNAAARTIAKRNQEFLDYGLTGYAETTDITPWSAGRSTTFSGVTDAATAPATAQIKVEAGASITSQSKGLILLAAPTVTNEGHLTAADGQVSLAGSNPGNSGYLTLYASKGNSGSIDPTVRGYAVFGAGGSVVNRGVIEADRGYLSLGVGKPLFDTNGTANGLQSSDGTLVNAGILSSTSSVSANGTIDVYAKTVTLDAGSIIRIAPDNNGETITQSASSLAAFKPSQVRIGRSDSDIVLAGTAPDGTDGALIAAPSGSVLIGAKSNASLAADVIGSDQRPGHITVNSGAVIDVSGMKNLSIPISAFNLSILLKGNELADSGGYQTSLLNGKTVTIDARLSGVREDGVAWVGSPLISAAAYYEAVGVTAAELMTKGGNVVLGTTGVSSSKTAQAATASRVTLNTGALIDVSGGWVTYQGGRIKTSQLLTTDGRVVDIGNASLSETYLSLYSGASLKHGHWGVVETWKTIRGGYSSRFTPSYSEGRDAGTVTIKTAQAIIEGSINAAAHPGQNQLTQGTVGTGTSAVYGDLRSLQGSKTERPSDGMLLIQLVGNADTDYGVAVGAGGSDIVVVADKDYVRSDGKTIVSDRLLNQSGLAQVSLWSSGQVSVSENARLGLSPGGTFDAYAGRAITIAGTVSVPSGSIRLETARFENTNVMGSAFSSADNVLAPGSLDIVVTGTLSAAGQWINDIGKYGLTVQGGAYLNGGTISIISAANVIDTEAATTNATPVHSTDLSGSIRIQDAKLIDLSGGGRVDETGTLRLTGKGGNLALIDQTAYFQTVTHEGLQTFSYIGQVGGFRGHFVNSNGITLSVAINPDKINSTVQFNPDTIRADGFAGGGTFTLWAPEIKFGSGTGTESALATALPLPFFQQGFASFVITSYKTDLRPNTFTNASGNSLGGYNAVLATQTLAVHPGETLALTQSRLPSILTDAQTESLRQLASGGDVRSILSAAVPTSLWDQKPVNLTLDGMVELVVAPGGGIAAAPGATLTVAKLKTLGSIRLPGGTILQKQTLPTILDPDASSPVTVYSGHTLGDIFSVEADGTILEGKASKIAKNSTNAAVAYNAFVYLLGDMEASDGIVLAGGSVTDLSGISVLNPYATGVDGLGIRTGTLYSGGTLSLTSALSNRDGGFYQTARLSAHQQTVGKVQTGRGVVIASGASLSLDGVSDSFIRSVTSTSGVDLKTALASINGTAQAVWSDAGSLSAPNGFTIAADAAISAKGGSSVARGGTLDLSDVVLTQGTTRAANELSANQIRAAGISTLIARGSLGSKGSVSLILDRALFVTSRPFNSGLTKGYEPNQSNTYAVTVRSGGDLDVTAPYIGLLSSMNVLSSSTTGTPSAANTVTLTATQAFDISGAVLFDRSVTAANLTSLGDLRLSGVPDYHVTYLKTVATDTPLAGLLAVNGVLSLTAAQLYPTTGSTFAIGATGDVTVRRAPGGTTPAAPYSAGSTLTITGTAIDQGGVIRVPLGNLSLTATTGALILRSGSSTEVSANGLVIPYGTTTDGKEWYFTPNGGTAIAQPPEKILTLHGKDITAEAGSTINISGGGDLTAYEFSAGTGGSRDVLNSYNSDPYTSKNGCTYAGCATAYAIVPGLSGASVAAFDPVYSANYASLASTAGTGKRVQLNLGDGLNWYTLLPAQYATLPGGMLVVEQSTATALAAGNRYTRADGTVLTSGVYGDALSGSADSTPRLFAVQSQSVFEKYSKIKLTSADSYFATLATKKAIVTPALPVDAGRLVLDPRASLQIKTKVAAAPGANGRGSKVDIGGTDISIGTTDSETGSIGTLSISADSLSNLSAESLLIGATRKDNSNGSTGLTVSATSIRVVNDEAHPVTAPEVILAATSGIDLADGAATVATGTVSDTRTGTYAIGDSTTPGTGVLVRVANGPERLTDRTYFTDRAHLRLGAAALSGQTVMVDTSGTLSISNALIISNAQSVAVGAGRIGIGAIATPGYSGAIVTPDMIRVLSQNGGRLTLRSQTSIDFADGSYSFGNIRFDASALSGTGGGAVTVNAGTVTLGNSGTANTVCSSCEANGGTLSIAADEILFSGGTIVTKATTTGATLATLAADIVVTLPKGTTITSGNTGTLSKDAQIVLPKGMLVSLAAGTGLIAPAAIADGLLPAGTEITVSGHPLFDANGKTFTVKNSLDYVGNGGTTTFTLAAGDYFSISTPLTLSIPVGSVFDLQTATTVSTKTFFAGGVDLTARNGIFDTGATGGLDSGSAPLALHTPYIGDRAAAATTKDGTVIPNLTLATQGAMKIDMAGTGGNGGTRLGGIPGTGLSVKGNAVDIDGTTIHASGGTVDIVSATGITLSNGAWIEAPSYTAGFGDSADSTTATAAAGRVSLTARSGNINIGTGTTLSVRGGNGSAGRLDLSAVAGEVILDGTIDGTGRSGGVFALESSGPIALASLNRLVATKGFSGGFEVHTHSGDLVLFAGETLRSGSVVLTADGGNVAIGGTIDASGINGGDIALFGLTGVTLEATARLDAHARGYDLTDPRQAKGGSVTLGTDFATPTGWTGDGVVTGTSGLILAQQGAVIDVSATQTANRLIPLESGLGSYYVNGDVGGTVTFRAPAVDTGGHQTVHIRIGDAAGLVKGARQVTVEGFRRWDLAKVVNSGHFTGITLIPATKTVTLDSRIDLDTANNDGTRSRVGGLNFLGDEGTGTIASFVQNFDISASAPDLGGLDMLRDTGGTSIFHARPGIDLAYEGNITLASTWNFGAGVVNIDAAVAAGTMTRSGGNASVVAGRESDILGRFTHMIYRTGGSAFGEAPVLTLRAGGNLHLDGSLTDGFFQFADPSASVSAGFGSYGTTTPDTYIIDFNPESLLGSNHYLKIIPASGTGGTPFNNKGNSVSAETAGDTLANSVLFPLACRDNTCSQTGPIGSASYILVAGAEMDRTPDALAVSVNPKQFDRNSSATFSVSGTAQRNVMNSANYRLLLATIYVDRPYHGYYDGWVEPTDFAANYRISNCRYCMPLSVDNATNIEIDFYSDYETNIATVVNAIQSDLTSNRNPELNALVAQYGQPSSLSPDSIIAPLGVFSYLVTHYGFTEAVIKDINEAALADGRPSPFPSLGSFSLTTRNMIRTGTGSISIAAAGTVDLTAGQPVNSTADAVPVYTAGRRAETKTVTAVNVANSTAATVTLNANPIAGGLFLVDGGDIAITAGNDVLGRTGTITSDRTIKWISNRSDGGSAASTIADQEINLIGFTTGIGTLAGGDIDVSAGRDIDTVAVAATPAIRTVSVNGTANGVQFLGDSTVTLTAERDILGGVVSVTSGSATMKAQRDIASDYRRKLTANATAATDMQTRLSILNATTTVTAGRNAGLTWGNLPFSKSNGSGWYSKIATLDLTAGGGVDIGAAWWPGSVTLAALTGDLTFRNPLGPSQRASILMEPAANGQLVLLAGGEIGTVSLAMLDADPVNMMGPFYNVDGPDGAIFPTVTSRTTQASLNLYHNPDITHRNDRIPLTVFAGRDITDVTLVSPKQARIVSGGDIVNMVFFGQNLSASDITRIAAAGDITATSAIIASANTYQPSVTAAVVQGNTFVIGGPGSFFLEAGGNIGPFLNSANIRAAMDATGTDVQPYTFGGGVLSVGYDWNPWLKDAVVKAGGDADQYVMFGLGKTGPAYDSFRDIYVNPAHAGALTWGGYGTDLVAWMQTRHRDELILAYRTTDIGEDQAYATFLTLSPLEQRVFLLSKVYFNELKQVAVTTSPSYQKYSRGYKAVNALFPAANGYTANGLEGGASDTALVHTGDLDLRLATLQTSRGGDIRLIGPGGNILAGSVVRTSTQAERRNYYWGIYLGENSWSYIRTERTDSIPVGLEGLITLRGGEIDSFTDGSLVLNQSRLFTQSGGDIVLWSSNADLNAGQGPKTSANYPPLTVTFDWNLFAEIDERNGVAGAGIAAFQPAPGIKAPDVYMLAPRGIVDAGDAGIRVAGNLSILAYQVRNADNISVAGQSFGVPVAVGPNLGALTSASDTAAAAAAAAEDAARASRQTNPRLADLPSIITFEVVGYGGGDGGDTDRRPQRERSSLYNPNGAVRFTSLGESGTSLR